MPRRITNIEAEFLNEEYVRTRGLELDNIVKKKSGNKQLKDNLSTWFSLEDLEGFIAAVKTDAEKQDIKLTGFRFYAGAYPKNAAGKEALSTIFIVPTTDKKPVSGGVVEKDSAVKNYDIQTINGFNEGQTGHPPSQPYPAT